MVSHTIKLVPKQIIVLQLCFTNYWVFFYFLTLQSHDPRGLHVAAMHTNCEEKVQKLKEDSPLHKINAQFNLFGLLYVRIC